MNLLIIKTGALGDVVRTSFLAQALTDKYRGKNPVIFWLTDEKALPFFMNNPYVSEAIPVQNKEKLMKIDFDIVINLEEDKETCQFASSLKYKEIIGFTYKDKKILPTSTAREWYNMSALGKKPENDILKKKNNKTHRQLMAQIVGIANYEKYEPFLRLAPEQREFANDFLRRYNLSKTDLIIGINTGSADRWPKSLSIKKTVQLIEAFYKNFKARILLFGGPTEIERNKEIMKLTKVHVIDTGCGNDLVEFPSLVSICNIFITTDSLGLHIALALKRKTICLIGPTSPNEIDLYGLGEKVIAKSPCVCCYKQNCTSMEKIDIKEIISAVKDISVQKITLLITAFKEPNLSKALDTALKQKTNYEYEIIVSAPDEETLNIARNYAKKSKKIKIFQDPGQGKSYALNSLLSSIKTDILVLTDGDVLISNNTVEEFANLFLDPEIGCATGRPVPLENKETKYGYWANFLFESAHRLRKQAFETNSFLECSGYLWAFRKKKVNKIPLDVAEDTVIPYYFWEKGYKIGYAEKAEVYVKNPDNWIDWIKQKTRTSKAHETLSKYVDIKITPRVKTFETEAKGIFWAFVYPKNLKEFFWTFQLVLARLYMWTRVFLDISTGKHYQDAWERVESTK